jgi:hypothetical protein
MAIAQPLFMNYRLPMLERFRRSGRAACLGLTAVLILLLFGDVLFSRASLAPIDYVEILANPQLPSRTVSWFPERSGRTILHGQGDIGAAAYQFEPAIKFMAFCLRSGESPFWDPYTATGALGPETTTDIKFSPFSIAVALLGGGSEAFNYVLVLLFALSCYCLMRACTAELGLSHLASFSACCVFFLNGFALMNLNTQIGQPYFLAPLLLRSLLLFTRRTEARYAALALAAHILFIATTFFPCAVLCGIVVYCVSAGARLSESVQSWRKLLVIHIALPVSAALCLAVIYVPSIAAQFSYLDMRNAYAARLTPGLSLVNLLSLFTPKHFWESYRAMRAVSAPPAGAYEMFVPHLGIVGPLLATYSVQGRKHRLLVVLLGFCFLCAVGQMFGIFPFTLIDRVVFFSFIRNEYWACMSSLSLVFLAGIGLDALARRKEFGMPAVLLLGIIGGSFFFLLGRVGLTHDPWSAFYMNAFAGIVAAATALLILARFPALTRYAAVALSLLLLAEGIFYMNNLRPYRSHKDTRLAPAIAWLKTQVDQHPGSRILDVGLFGIYPDWGSALQVPELGNLGNGELPWYRDFYNKYVGRGLYMSLPYPDNEILFTDDSLSLASVRYVMVDRNMEAAIARLHRFGYPIVMQDSVRFIFENPNPQPRAFLVSAVGLSSELPSKFGLSSRVISSTADEEFLKTAGVNGISRVDFGSKAIPERPSPGTVEIIEYRHTRVRMRSTAGKPSVLVFADSWTPNWKAFVNGKPVEVAKVDAAFRGILVPGGTNEVVFRYDNRFVVAGEVVSGFAVLLSLMVLCCWHRGWLFATAAE